DLRAEIAARLGHRAVALAACRPAHFGDTPPVPLRGREAWISAAFGDVASAMTQMKQILRERPDYAWGHRELAEWADDAGEQQTALEAAKRSFGWTQPAPWRTATWDKPSPPSTSLAKHARHSGAPSRSPLPIGS